MSYTLKHRLVTEDRKEEFLKKGWVVKGNQWDMYIMEKKVLNVKEIGSKV